MSRVRIIMFGAALLLVPAVASAQGWGWGNNDAHRDRDGYNDNLRNRSYAYQVGYRQGWADFFDNRHTSMDKRRFHGRERGEWRSGYSHGYNEARRDARNNNGRYGRNDDRWGRNDDRWGRNGGYGGLYGNGARQARDIGYADGRQLGERDRRTGHSYRYFQHDRYKDGDRGYDRSFGDKETYRRLYRSAFEEGYREGWGR